MKAYERTEADLLEAPRYGKLFKVVRVHGERSVACRCRVRAGKLILKTDERITVKKEPQAWRNPRVGDFFFVARGAGETDVALWRPAE